jgi:hypothetical protein
MKRSLVLGIGVAALLVAAPLGWSQLRALSASPASAVKQRSGFLPLPPAAPAGQMTLFGHIKTLTRKGSRYRLRFDPAWFTSGITANTAAAEDGAVPKGQPVPNDNYIVDDSHRLLTYLVPTNAHVTVLTNQGTKGISATPITVAELARIVNGGKHRKLFEPLDSGVWIRVRIDTVRELDQQYRP